MSHYYGSWEPNDDGRKSSVPKTVRFKGKSKQGLGEEPPQRVSTAKEPPEMEHNLGGDAVL